MFRKLFGLDQGRNGLRRRPPSPRLSRSSRTGFRPQLMALEERCLLATFNEFLLPTGVGRPIGITAGPDGNLWFTESVGKIGRITPAGTITEFPIPTAGSAPYRITAGPDGNLWFTELSGFSGKI